MSELPNQRLETRSSVAYEMGTMQEEYQRVRDMKAVLGIESDESHADGVEQVTETARDRETRGTTLAGVPDQLIRNGRYEISKEINNRIKNNLAENGWNTDEYGNIIPGPELKIAPEYPRAARHILDQVAHIIDRTTSSKMDHDDKRNFWLSAQVFDTEGRDDRLELSVLKNMVINGVGLDADTVNNTPKEPHGVTSAGWQEERKRVPTAIPGIFYEESFFTPPAGNEAAPITRGVLTALPEGSDNMYAMKAGNPVSR